MSKTVDPAFIEGYVKAASDLGMEKMAIPGLKDIAQVGLVPLGLGALVGSVAGAAGNYVSSWATTPTDDDIAILEDKALIEEMRRTQESIDKFKNKQLRGMTPREIKPLRGFDA